MLACVVVYRRHGRQASPFPVLLPNSFPLNSFADPHPLNPVASILYENMGGGGAGSPFLLLISKPLTSQNCLKSFVCITYGSPRKCCKQKTYGQAKSFRCNTYKKQGGGVPIMVNQESKKGFLSRGVPRAERFMDASLLNALFPRRLEFVAGEPARQRRQPCRLRSEHERESGDDRVARKIHVRAVLVARLVITMLDEIFCLIL